MDQEAHPLSRRKERINHLLHLAIATSWIGFCVVFLGLDMDPGGRLRSMFVWLDVLLVCLLCSMPVAVVLVQFLRLINSREFLRVCTWLSFIAAGMTLAALQGNVPWYLTRCSGLSGYVIRPLLGLILVGPAVLVGTARVVGRPRSSGVNAAARHLMAWVAATVMLGMVLPSTYVAARCDRDAAQLETLLEKSRLGEAAALARGLMFLAPDRHLKRQPISRLVFDLDRTVRRLRAEVAAEPDVDEPDEVWWRYAQKLAILGQTSDALGALERVTMSTPQKFLLIATIHETRYDWKLSEENYSKARHELQLQSTSPKQIAGQIQAVTGIAYCRRKQGRYREAEVAYQELLVLAPTADVHYLLAQFYEDTQQTVVAREHALAAIKLAPDRMTRPGKQLLNKLATMHFGCFTVASNSIHN